MKTIYLIRHAKSSWNHPDLRDKERPLNNRGLRDAPFMAKHLKELGVEADLIVSSPANRAHSTAKYFAETLACEIEVNNNIYEAFTSKITSIIQGLSDDLETVLLFGHNPTFTNVSNLFPGEYIPNVPTCGIIKIEGDVKQWKNFNENTAQQTAFYYPKQFFS